MQPAEASLSSKSVEKSSKKMFPFKFKLSGDNSGDFWQVLIKYASQRNGGRRGEMFICSKIAAKSFGDRSQDICKDTESNLGAVAGF